MPAISASGSFFFPELDTVQQHATHNNSNSNPNHTTPHIRTTTLDRPLTLSTFFIWPPSASTFASFTSTYTSDDSRYRSTASSKVTMPVSAFAAPERTAAIAASTSAVSVHGLHGPTSTYVVANKAATTGHWRPHSAQSGRSSRSGNPLFARWARRHHQQQQQPVDPRSSTETQNSSTSKSRRHNHTRSGNLTRTASIQKRQSHAGLPPPLTRDEFEALPLAIQRKYFSTLERLRFAQESGTDRISQHYDQISTHNFKRRRPRQTRSASHFPEPRFITADSLPFTNLSDKIKKRLLTGEEQLALERRPRTSVVLDAADEAVYKLGRKASRNPPRAPAASSRRNSMDFSPKSPGHLIGSDKNSNVPDSFYESFRWLDEEDNLDLRLFLDDYHSNLRENVPSPTTQRRPSFRRRMSISKIPFGRSSASASRPGTKDTMMSPISPTHGPVSPKAAPVGHTRRRSRALSLITPKHTPHGSTGVIDPAAAHYQDPEARLKLRVYLASPQKFDEAIEFGFPSTDALSSPTVTAKESRALSRQQSRQKLSDDSSNLRSFLDDVDDDDDDDDEDKLSMNSDEPSVTDPDSPRTPQTFDKPTIRPHRGCADPAHTHVSKPSEASYVQASVSSREMTLRMTLTRPDLRAHEDQLYGWQKPGHLAGKRSQTSHLRDDSTTNVTYIGEKTPKESIEKVLAGIDHWNATESDNSGVMKRIWNRVRRA